jgi:type II secretory pathway component PulF
MPASVTRSRVSLTRGLPSADLADGLTSLGHLLGAGLPLVKALEVLQGTTSSVWAAVLPSIRVQVERGETLSAALATSSLRIPRHLLGLIGAAEAGGGLTEAIERAADLAEGESRVRSAVREALAYPMILLVAGGASTALLATVVLPAFAELLGSAGRELPLTTRVVLSVSDVVLGTWQWVLLSGLFGVLWWFAWVAGETGRARWHGLLLRIPGISGPRRSLATARFCAALAALADSGLPLPRALSHAGEASGDAAMGRAAEVVRQRVAEGAPMASAMAEHRVFAPAAVRMIAIGEETGRLGPLLAHAGRIERELGMRRLLRATRLIEPVLILAFGAVVAVVAAALLQAMYAFGPAS